MPAGQPPAAGAASPAPGGDARAAPPAAAHPGTFRALRHRNYRLWFFGQGLSLVGTWMQTMAQQVLVYRLTGSAAALGVVSFVGVVPLLCLALVGGSVADRFPKRRVILGTQAAMLLQAVTLAALTFSGRVQIWHVYLLAFLLGAVQAIDSPARQAFTVEMVEGKEDLTNAIALNSAIFNGARALGPALAGVAVATLGEAMAFFVNGLSFLAVITGLLLMQNLPRPAPRPAGHLRLTAHLAEGARYVSGQRTILLLMSLVAVSSFAGQPYTTMMPVFADTVLKESAQPVVSLLCYGEHPPMRCLSPQALPLGILLTAVGVGAVLGALLVASLPASARRGRMLTIGNLGFPSALLGFALSRSFLLSMALLMVVGMSWVWQQSLANTLLQVAIPDEMRGRVMSFYMLTSAGGQRLGGLQAGLVTDQIGAPLSIGLGAAVSLAWGLAIAFRQPRLRQMV